jgi:large subunit ribosomal protein L18
MNRTVVCQLVEYSADGDRVVAAASSRDLVKFGWKGHPANLPSAYLTGLLLGQKAKRAGAKKAILDLGLQSTIVGSRVFAALKGALDAGLEVPHDDIVLPSDDRISGKHIEDYAKAIAGTDAYKRQFSGYAKQNMKAEGLVSLFTQIKDKILAM